MGLSHNLLTVRGQIAATKPLDDSFPVDLVKWDEGFSNVAAWQAVRGLFPVGPMAQISRALVLDQLRGGLPHEVGFMLIMLWGYGSENSTAFNKVRKMTEHRDFGQNLTGAIRLLGAGDPKSNKKAFRQLLEIPELGVSYATKVLYFETRVRRSQGYLPIFDNRVARALVGAALASEDRWLLDSLALGRGGNWKAYEAYLTKLEVMAGQLEVDVEQLEFWLFKNNGEEAGS